MMKKAVKRGNEKDIKIECEKCGKSFMYHYRGCGKKPKFCVDCSPKPRERNAELEKCIDEQPSAKVNISGNEDYDKFWINAINILQRVDTCRVELCELCNQLKQYQSGFDKIDQVYQHNLEDLNMLDMNAVYRFVADWKASRENRRDVKDIVAFLAQIIDSIPLKCVANAYSYREKLDTDCKKGSYLPKSNIVKRGKNVIIRR